MSKSKIEWLARPGTIPVSWNPITGCDPDDGCQSEACVNCWARRMSKRLAGRAGYDAEHPFHITMHRDKMDVPYSWRKTRTVFVVSMGDLFHSTVPWRWIDSVFDVMVHCRKHTFILCTKRAKNMHDFITACYPGLDQCCPHIWGLVTAETQEQADERIPWLLRTPLAVRGVSVEPMLERIDIRLIRNEPCSHPGCFSHISHPCEGCGYQAGRLPLDWIVCGAETGPRARPTHPVWATRLKDQTKQAGLPFFWKSNGEWISVDQLGYIMAPGETYADKGWATPKEHVFEDGTICVRLGRQHTGHLLCGKEWREWPAT